MELVFPNCRPFSPKFGRSISSMSPAAQRLAHSRLGIGSKTYKALRASYTPSPSHRTPGSKTPISLTPSVAPKSGTPFSVKAVSRGVQTFSPSRTISYSCQSDLKLLISLSRGDIVQQWCLNTVFIRSSARCCPFQRTRDLRESTKNKGPFPQKYTILKEIQDISGCVDDRKQRPGKEIVFNWICGLLLLLLGFYICDMLNMWKLTGFWISLNHRRLQMRYTFC